MSDERRSEAGNAIVVIIVVLIVIGVLGIVGVGGGALLFFRLSRQEAVEQERRALVEMNLVEMQAALQRVEAEKAATGASVEQSDATLLPAEEIILQIDAAGNYMLAGKPLTPEELPAALQQAKSDHPNGLQLKIQADRNTPFERVSQATKAANAAGITSQNVATQP
jgi:biopolymer transport protein ExbD